MRATKITGADAKTEIHRTRFGKVRWTAGEYAELVERAKDVGLTVSSYIRHVALGKKPVPAVDLLWIAELRRIGGLLRHRYPQVKSSNWTAQEKQKYWQTREELLQFADQVTRKVMGKKAQDDPKSGARS
jgi:hypothetical protein